MQLRCKNLGPIKDGTIDIDKDFIILCGKNNSGKSYLSYLLYGILKGEFSFIGIEPFIKLDSVSLSDFHLDPSIKTARINIDLVKLEALYETNIIYSIGKLIHNRFVEIFQDTDKFDNTKFEVKLPAGLHVAGRGFQSEHSGNIALPSDSINDSFTTVSFLKNRNSTIVTFWVTEGKNLQSKDLTPRLIKIIHEVILTIIVIDSHTYTLHHTYFFPAERIALDVFNWDIIKSRDAIGKDMQAYHAISAIHYSKADKLQGTARSLRMPSNDTDKFYPLPIRDFLIRSSSYPLVQDNKGEMYDMGVELEHIMGVELSTNTQNIDNIHIDVKVDIDKNVPIKLASSTVKSLASFIFYLKHEAQNNHAVFFDEPELGLHPALQRKLAVILVKLVRKGIKLIVSTHSDFLLREFNNLIMLHQDTPGAKKLLLKYSDIGYNSLSTLDPKSVGVNVLVNNTIDSIEISETGFDISAIDDVINDQNKIAEDIYYSLF